MKFFKFISGISGGFFSKKKENCVLYSHGLIKNIIEGLSDYVRTKYISGISQLFIVLDF